VTVAKTLLIEPMTSEDLAEVLAIERASFDDPWSLGSFRDLLMEPAASWVALENAHVVGYLVTIWAADEIHLVNLAVHTDRRRQGIGSELMNLLMEKARTQNMRAIFLEVRRKNRAAIEFYHRFGFQFLYERKDYYGDGEDAWIMQCAVAVQGEAHPEVPPLDTNSLDGSQ
jgi:ribosomal-protein-alanine N-acetyltransferase